MDIVRMAKYYYGISNLPVALYHQDELLTQYCVRVFKPDLAHECLKRFVVEQAEASMDALITYSGMICGFVREKSTGQLLFVGPLMEAPCTRKKAYHILDDIGQPKKRADELMAFFEKIPTMPLATFMRNMIFLNYIVNGEILDDKYMSDKLIQMFGPEKEIHDRDRTIPHSTRDWDRQLESCVEYGRVDELDELWRMTLSEGRMGVAAVDALRSFKNVVIASIALIARAASRGGMDYEAALTKSDEFAVKVEALQTREEVGNLIKQVFYYYTEQVAKIRNNNTDSRIARKVAGYIQEHMYEPISNTDIAEYLNLNVSYLCRSFKKDTGKTIVDFVNEMKVDEAKRLLTVTDMPVIDIAMYLGYSAQAYFSTLFKKISGMSPMEYRNANKK